MVSLLIVENDEVTRSLFQLVFSGDDWRLRIVQDIRSALQCYRTEPVDILVTDVFFPGECGTSLAETIRHLERTEGRRAIPIIGISAGVQEENRLRCLASGMDAFFGKPFKIDAIKAKIDELLAAYSQ